MLLNNTFATLNNSINNQKETQKSLNKLSTGLKINQSSDDASGLSIADKLRTQATGIKQGIENANSAVALLQITDKSMNEISNILDIVKAKLIQAHTHTTSDEGRISLKKDIEKLLSQIDNISNQSSYNDTKLLAHSGLDFQLGSNPSDTISVPDIHTSLEGLSGISYNKDFIINSNTIEEYTHTPTINQDNIYSKSNMTDDDWDEAPTNYINDILHNQLLVKPSGSKVININMDINTDNFRDIPIYTTQNEYTNITIPQGGLIFPKDQDTNDYFEEIFAENHIYAHVDISKGSDPTLGDYYYFNENYYMADNTRTEIFTQERTLNFDYSQDSSGDPHFDNVIVNTIEPQMKEYTYNNPGFTITTLIPPNSNDVDIHYSWHIDTSNLTKIDPNASGLCGTLQDLHSMSNDSFNFECAGNFQEVVDYALNLLNNYRSEIGSSQNQVESVTRNLMTSYVNIKNAESVIRDVDYANESANFNKLNILNQAGSFAQVQNSKSQERILELLEG